jgi:beta-lactamase superfamily II metal-dependent hydrolase
VIFTLEALRAKHGDSLVLHFGEADAPRFIVIDGGPSGVYADAFRPRLDELAARWSDGDGQLPIDVLMVSHMDDDHIRGVLDLSERLTETSAVEPSPFRIATLWHNSFSDVIGRTGTGIVASTVAESPARVAAAAGEASPWEGNAQAVVASVPQARKLRDNAAGLGWTANRPFAGLVAAPAAGGHVERFGPLTLTVVGPLEEQVEALRVDWEKKVRALRQAGDAKAAQIAAKDLDDSVYNLSSIVCLAELEETGKRMLLTGDARGDHVLDGLERARLTDANGEIEVDVLKLPHHGSDRNVDDAFFRRIRARHYVISGDGKHDNPEPETLRMISRNRPDGAARDDFTIHLTYERLTSPKAAEIETFLADERTAGRRYEVRRRPDAELSLRVDLLDAVDY